jgi:PAS domain S-box-containing protein
LRESEERLRSLGDNLPDSYVYQFMYDADLKPHFIYLSAGVEKLHGLKPHDILQDADLLMRQISPEQIKKMIQMEQQSLLTMQDIEIELQILHSDGRWRWLHLRSRPQRTQEGQVFWYGLANEITELKKSEEEMQRISHWLFASQRLSATGGWAFDMKNSFVWASPEARRIYGLGDQPLTISFIKKFPMRKYRPILDRALKNLIQKGIPYDVEFKIVRGTDGTVIDVHSVAEYHPNEKLVLGVLQDITERKQTKEAIQKLNLELEDRVIARTAQLQKVNKELEAFSYSVSHDLRTPLRSINGFTKILMEDYAPALDTEGKRLCSIILENSVKMGQLIDDLLAFSRLGRSEMKHTRIDMKNLVHSVYHESYEVEVREKITLNIGNLGFVRGDPSMLRQVWHNLLSNAVKYTSKTEHPVISVSCTEQNHTYIYCIRDNGIGFDMNYKNKLFGVFQRLHNIKEYEGTGVGLAIVHRIITRHGGQVWAEGEVNQGASFYFTLPAKNEKNQSMNY